MTINFFAKERAHMFNFLSLRPKNAEIINHPLQILKLVLCFDFDKNIDQALFTL